MVADEVDGLAEGGSGDAEIDARVDDLADGVDGRRPLGVVPDDGVRIHMDVLQDRGAGTGDALSETIPVVDDLDAFRHARNDGQGDPAGRVEREDGDPPAKRTPVECSLRPLMR